jgi:DNA polymerase-1
VANQRYIDRAFFEAPPGRVIIGADKDQVELRIMACLAGVSKLLEVMADPNSDPHTWSATQVYGEEFTSKPPAARKLLRNMFKNVVYASIYMAVVDTVWRTIREKKQLDAKLRAAMTHGFVERAYNGYFSQFPEIPAFHYGNMAKVEKVGYIENAFGWRRYFPLYPAPLNDVANWPIQSTATMIVTGEMIQIQQELKQRYHGTAYIILHGHDACYIECNERDAEDITKIVDRIFGRTKLDGPKGSVYLTSKADIGTSLLTAAAPNHWKDKGVPEYLKGIVRA